MQWIDAGIVVLIGQLETGHVAGEHLLGAVLLAADGRKVVGKQPLCFLGEIGEVVSFQGPGIGGQFFKSSSIE